LEAKNVHSTMSECPSSTDKQIQFARHHFDNLQNLIRFVDTKAGFVITAAAFLGATLIPVAKESISHVHASPCSAAWLSGLFLTGCAGFILTLAWVLVHVQQVLRPRGAQHYRQTSPGHDLMWQDHVIAHQANAGYFAAVRAASDEILLRNITDQIFELAHISKQKMDAFHQARIALWGSFSAWVTAIIFGVALLRW
jgi:hypothetical protein